MCLGRAPGDVMQFPHLMNLAVLLLALGQIIENQKNQKIKKIKRASGQA